MRVLFVSRKKKTDIGGLARFGYELTSRFPNAYLLSSDRALRILKLPFIDVDLIHLCDATLLPLGVFLKLIFRKPLTLTAHGLDLVFPNPLYQWMLRMLLPQADAIILDSESVLPLLSSYHLSPHKVHVIHPGISIAHLKIKSSLERPRLLRLDLKDKIVLVTVGNLVVRKGHVWFIKNVFRLLSKDFVYLIVGDGAEKGSIEQAIKNVGLTNRIFLLGRLSDGELSFVFSKTDIYVCPNQEIEGDFEGFGIAAGEAAAMGIPVVASNVDGIPEIIKHGKNGLLVKPNPSSFLAAIKTLTDKAERQNIGKKAKTYTRRHFSWEQTSKRYLTVFAKEIRKKKESPPLSSPM